MSPSISCCLHARVMPEPITFDFRGNLKRFLPNSGEELQFIPAFHLDWEGLGVRPSVRMSVCLPDHPACPSIAWQGNTTSATVGEKSELRIVQRTEP